MKLVLLSIWLALPVFAQTSQPVKFVTVDPSGSCSNGTAMRYNWMNGRFWGCLNGSWALASSGGGASSVFSGSTAVPSGFTATPTFSLAAITSQSPVRFEPGALTGNITSVTFSNKTAGAKFSIAWLQDGTGGRTVTYGVSAHNTCTIDTTAGVITTQQFEVGSDGSTVNGTGCSSNGTGSVFPGTVQAAGYKSSDGTAGVTGSTCTAWKNGLCVAN